MIDVAFSRAAFSWATFSRGAAAGWRARLVVGAAAVPLLLSGLGCGGGGGGGGGGGALPTAPAPPPPPSGPGPSSEQAGDQTLFGGVEGLFEPGTSFTGSTIRIVGAADDTIRTDNSFFLDPVPIGSHVLSVSGPDLLNRKVEITMQAGGANEIPALDLAESARFNLAAFDEIYRDEGERGTARFTRRPEFFVDRKSFDSLPGASGARLMSDIEMAIKGPIRRVVGPLFAGVRVTVRPSLRRYQSPCDLPIEEINWYGDRNLTNEEGEPLLGQAWWCWFPSQNRVRGGILTLDDAAGSGTILHELVHILGTADHLEKTAGSSVIRAPRSLSVLSEMDEQHLTFLYRRPPGLTTPDDARGLGASSLTSLAGGSGMEVRCDIFPDGRVELESGPSGWFEQ